jgi:hypothetical protein
MEYVQGRTLADILRANGHVSSVQAAEIASEVSAALSFAHKQRRGAPRHQAGQHPHRHRRPGEGGRLRHRPGDERAHREQPHPGRLGDGHRHVLLARAGAGRAARPAQRPVLARHRALRDGGRQAAVHRREPGGHRLQAGARRPAAAQPARRRRAPPVRGDRREAAREEARDALRRRRRRCATTSAASVPASRCTRSPGSSQAAPRRRRCHHQRCRAPRRCRRRRPAPPPTRCGRHRRARTTAMPQSACRRPVPLAGQPQVQYESHRTATASTPCSASSRSIALVVGGVLLYKALTKDDGDEVPEHHHRRARCRRPWSNV